MKKILLFLFLFFFLVNNQGTSWAQCTEEIPCPELARLGLWMGGGVPVAAPSGCASGTLINETFNDDTNYDLGASWSEIGTTPNPNSTGHSFADGSDEVLYVANQAENEIPLYSKYNHGSGVDVSYHRIKFYIASHDFTTGGDYVTIFNLYNTSDAYLFRVRATYVDADSFTLNLEIHGTEVGDVASDTLDVGVEYTLEVYWNGGAKTWAWRIDGVAVEAAGTTDSTRGSWQYTYVGPESGTVTSRGVNIYYECYGVSTAGWVGD